jgi:hypothetical protein
MKRKSRLFLFGAMILVLLTAACGAEGTTPTVVGTELPGDETSTPAVDTSGTAETEIAETSTGDAETPTLSATEDLTITPTTDGTVSAGITQTPVVPVTGPQIVLIECQFCVDTMAHALLVLPDTATFEITSPAASTTTSSTSVQATTPTCNTVEVNNGKQVVLCSGPEMTPLTLNICTDASTCTDFPVDLLACPATPVAPNPTQVPGTGAGSPTPTSGVTISTATPSTGATVTVTPTP